MVVKPPDGGEEPSTWRLLLRWRWLLGGLIAVAFALGRLLEALLLHQPLFRSGTALDVLLWGLLGGLAVWISLTWASHQERRYQSELAHALMQQRALNGQLQRANHQLSLLSDVNQQIADSASLDEILDAALAFPQRLVPARAAALWLSDPMGEVLARSEGASEREVGSWARHFGATLGPTLEQWPHPAANEGQAGALLTLPLRDGTTPVGWIALRLAQPATLADDERALLATIGGELGEAITSARRRTREERALFALEQALAEERARIARDIHDGLAQTLAFRRMRVDLWLDWIEEEPARLREELLDLKQMLREQIAELRRAIFALRPVGFDELGFVGGLHRYIEEFAQQQGWTAQVELGALPATLSPRLEAICFRIVQEALTNAAKHAGARQISVAAALLDGGLHLSIRDDGRGFAPGVAAGVSDRLGLRQMRERLAALNGRLTVLSQPGQGTELRTWFPYSDDQAATTPPTA